MNNTGSHPSMDAGLSALKVGDSMQRKLSAAQRNVLIALASGLFGETENYHPITLRELAKAGLIEIVSGIAFRTAKGILLLPNAESMEVTWND